MLNPDIQSEYMGIAREQPNILCSDVPPALLEAASWDGEEPSPFFVEFFSTGYLEWLASETGQRIRLPKEILDQVVLGLWSRACYLHTSRLLSKANPDWEKQLFSDEGII
jgi:hypothetical protein